MGKKRVLSLILMLMIVICCMTEAIVIGWLKAENAVMKEEIKALAATDEQQQAVISGLDSELTEMAKDDIPEVYLPEDIYVCSGLVMELYNDCVAVGIDYNEYDFYWECQVGDCMEDKWRIHADDSMIGEYALNLHIYNLKLEELTTASTTVHVVPNTFANEQTGQLKVLAIGDSMSAGTNWLSYTRFLSGEKINYLGTLGAEDGLMHEGRNGAMAADYLAGTLYGAPADYPFINPATGVFDWGYYKAATGIEPDVIQIFLGTNSLAMDPTLNVNDIFAMIDKIREADPQIPILLVEPIYPANQDGMARQQNMTGYESLHGMWAASRQQMVYNLIEEMDKRVDSYDNVTLVPAAVMFDRMYGYDQEMIRVSPQSDVVESVPAQAIHPSAQGYAQIGDSIYSSLCYLVDQKIVETTHEEETGE